MRSLRTASAWLAVLSLTMLCAIAFGAHAGTANAAHDMTKFVLPFMIGATNTLGNYNETFFAQEALIQLEKVMGMAGRVYRDYEPSPQVKGDTIQVRRPSTFTAQAAPSSDQNVTTESVSIVLNQWQEVKFSLTDKDLTLTSDRIISDHIRPAAVALADKIDQVLAALYKDIPWFTTMTATPALADISAIRKVMFNNNVPLKDQSNLNFMIGGTEEAAFLNAMTVLQNPQASGLRDGSIGRLYGFDTWANQNTPSHTSGVAADFTGTVDGVNAVGVSTILFSAVTAGITWKTGDSFSIAGDTQRYVATADGTDADGSAASITFAPALKKATAGTEVITLQLGGSAKTQNLAFHKNAFCLATAPLSDLGNQLGARIATVADPITGIALRSRLFYMPDSSAVKVALDILFGVKTLDCNLACRGYAA